MKIVCKSLLSAVFVATWLVPVSAQTTITLTGYQTPTAGSQPRGITKGPDGALWFTEYSGNKIGRISTAGVITEYPLPAAASNPTGITAGPDGALWFTEYSGNRIGRITTEGVISYPVVGTMTKPTDIIAGPNGTLWFIESSSSRIGMITTTGKVIAWSSVGSIGVGLTWGPDGWLWIGGNRNWIWRMDPSAPGNHSYDPGYPVGSTSSYIHDIVTGPDGALWFTDWGESEIGRMTTAGGGALWFGESQSGNLGRITTSGVVTEYPVGFAVKEIAVGPDGALWFTGASGNSIGRAAISGGGGTSACSYAVAAGAPNPPSFTAAGGSGTVTVTATPGCFWAANSSDPSWLSSTSTGSGTGTANYTVATNTGANSRTGTLTVGGQALTVTQAAAASISPGTPVISAGGVVNTASYSSERLALGSLFTIFGSNIGPKTPVKVSGYPLPSTLGGASVLVKQGFNLYSAPMIFASENQINAVLPSNLQAASGALYRAQVSVNYNGMVSQSAEINVAKTAFGGFFQRVNGTDLAIAQNQDYRLNTPDTPAKPGEIVIFWGTGLGPIAMADNIAPGPIGDMASLPVTITVGGITAKRIYAGRQSETAGVDNIYFIIPAGAPYGCQVPVAITADGVAANTTNIAITADGSKCQDLSGGVCANIAGQWLAAEKGTLTCTLTLNGQSDTETDPVDGSDTVTISQQGCNVSYTSQSIMAAFGSGQSVRQGQVEGTNVKVSGVMGQLAPDFSYQKNVFEASGAAGNNVINLVGSGTLTGSGVWQGKNATFSCTAATTATLKKLP